MYRLFFVIFYFDLLSLPLLFDLRFLVHTQLHQLIQSISRHKLNILILFYIQLCDRRSCGSVHGSHSLQSPNAESRQEITSAPLCQGWHYTTAALDRGINLVVLGCRLHCSLSILLYTHVPVVFTGQHLYELIGQSRDCVHSTRSTASARTVSSEQITRCTASYSKRVTILSWSLSEVGANGWYAMEQCKLPPDTLTWAFHYFT